MTTRYHINPKTGNPGQCRAQVKDCPFGLAIEDHFQSKEAARLWYEEQNSSFTPSKITEEQVDKAYARAAKLMQRYSSHDDSSHPEFESDFADAKVAAQDYLRIMGRFAREENSKTEEEFDEIWEEEKEYDPEVTREEIVNSITEEDEENFKDEMERARLRSLGTLETLEKLNQALSDKSLISTIAKDKALFLSETSQKYHDNERLVGDFIERAKEEVLKNTTKRGKFPLTEEGLSEGGWLGTRSYFNSYVKRDGELFAAILNGFRKKSHY